MVSQLNPHHHFNENKRKKYDKILKPEIYEWRKTTHIRKFVLSFCFQTMTFIYFKLTDTKRYTWRKIPNSLTHTHTHKYLHFDWREILISTKWKEKQIWKIAGSSWQKQKLHNMKTTRIAEEMKWKRKREWKYEIKWLTSKFYLCQKITSSIFYLK